MIFRQMAKSKIKSCAKYANFKLHQKRKNKTRTLAWLKVFKGVLIVCHSSVSDTK